MIRAKVAYLIAEDPAAHGVFDDPQETRRMVYCTEKSVGQSEAYQARGTGLNPEKKLILRHAFEYHGEDQVEYEGERWRVIRTYRDADSMELTLERIRGNAAAPAAPADTSGEATPADEAAPADEPDAPAPGGGDG
jgi:hypothetical protein